MVSVDFFVVPTIRFQILYVFLVLAHERRRILHFAVTAHRTAERTAQQMREAFPWNIAPRYLLRDRDRIFGQEFVKQVKTLGIKQVLSAPRCPWQRAYASNCTSFAHCGITMLASTLFESFTPWAFRGGFAPGCSYKQSFLPL